VHHEFLYQGQTVNHWYYLKVLKRLRENVRSNKPKLWKNNSWFLHHDNAPAHALLLIRDFLAHTSTTVLPQPPCSPDLAPADFFLFPKLKSALKGRFQTIQVITEISQKELRAVPKKEYQDCFQKWQRRWERCINAGGEYFEDDKDRSVAGMSEEIIKNSFETF
jgi:transposase